MTCYNNDNIVNNINKYLYFSLAYRLNIFERTKGYCIFTLFCLLKQFCYYGCKVADIRVELSIQSIRRRKKKEVKESYLVLLLFYFRCKGHNTIFIIIII